MVEWSLVGWAIKAGFFVAAPTCLVVGSAFAVSTSFSAFHRTWPKLLGWLGGIPIAFVSGVIIAPFLAPFFWIQFAAVFCSGFGWLAVWGAITIFGRTPDESVSLRPDDRAERAPKRRPDFRSAPLQVLRDDLEGEW